MQTLHPVTPAQLPSGRAQHSRSIIFLRRCRLEDHLSLKSATGAPSIPSLPREAECLDLTPWLLAESAEALQALNPEYLLSPDSCPRSRCAQGLNPLLGHIPQPPLPKEEAQDLLGHG